MRFNDKDIFTEKNIFTRGKVQATSLVQISKLLRDFYNPNDVYFASTAALFSASYMSDYILRIQNYGGKKFWQGNTPEPRI